MKCAWQESNLLPFGPEQWERSPRPSPHLPVDPVSYSGIRGDHPLTTPGDRACPRSFVTIQVTKGRGRKSSLVGEVRLVAEVLGADHEWIGPTATASLRIQIDEPRGHGGWWGHDLYDPLPRDAFRSKDSQRCLAPVPGVAALSHRLSYRGCVLGPVMHEAKRPNTFHAVRVPRASLPGWPLR